MPQTGKTPKKQPSSAQEEFKAAARQQRAKDLAYRDLNWVRTKPKGAAGNRFAVGPTSGYEGTPTLTYQQQKIASKRSATRRSEQQTGRMSFAKERVPYALRPVPFQKDSSQLDKYISAKHSDVRDGEPSIASHALDRAAWNRGINGTGTVPLTKEQRALNRSLHGGTPLPVSPTVAARYMAGRTPPTRNRPRGKSIVGMMAAPFAAGAGALLREQMMKQQPRKK